MIIVYIIQLHAILIGIVVAYILITIYQPEEEGSICPFGMEHNDKVQNTFQFLLEECIRRCYMFSILGYTTDECKYRLPDTNIWSSDIFYDKQFQTTWKNCLLSDNTNMYITSGNDEPVQINLQAKDGCVKGPIETRKNISIPISNLILAVKTSNNVICKKYF